MCLTKDLNNAIFIGDVEKVGLLLAQGAPVNVLDEHGNRPINYVFGNIEIARLLLAHGAFPHVLDENEDTVLHNYGALGNVEIVQLFLDRGVSPHAVNKQGRTPLHYPRSPSIDSIELLLKHGVLPNARDKNGQTPLHFLGNWHWQVVAMLLNWGAEIDVQDEHGNTPLHNAVEWDNLAVTNMLLCKGASVFIRNNECETPLHKASNTEQVEMLLKRDAEINAQDKQNRTLLHKAAVGRFFTMAKWLLAKGASPYVKDIEGETPIHEASKANLIDNSGSVSFSHTRNVFEEINHKEESNKQVIKLLLGYKDLVYVRDKYGNTPLHTAAKFSNDPLVVEALLEGEAPVNVGNKEGMTPLHVAVIFSQSLSIVKRLCEYKGTAINIRDKEGNTPLSLALQGEKRYEWVNRKALYRRMIHLLLSYGAYVYQPFTEHLFKYWELPWFMLEEDIHFFSTLLLAGITPSYHSRELPNPLQLIWDNIESTVKSWLSPCISEANKAEVNWSEVSCKVLRALPRLMHFIKRLQNEDISSISQDCTLDVLKSFLFIPEQSSQSNACKIYFRDDSEEALLYKKVNEDEWKGLHDREMVLCKLTREKRLPVEILLAIREHLTNWAMVDILVSDYQLDAWIANYLVFDVKTHFKEYVQFHK